MVVCVWIVRCLGLVVGCDWSLFVLLFVAVFGCVFCGVWGYLLGLRDCLIWLLVVCVIFVVAWFGYCGDAGGCFV